MKLITGFTFFIEDCTIDFMPTFTEPTARFEFEDRFSIVFTTLYNDIAKMIDPNTSKNNVMNYSFETLPREVFVVSFEKDLSVSLRIHFERVAQKFGLHKLILKVFEVGGFPNTGSNRRMMAHLFSKKTKSFLRVHIFVSLSK
jgi:hypothetical protein